MLQTKEHEKPELKKNIVIKPMGSKGRGCSAVRVCRQGAEHNAVVILPGRKSQRRVDRIRTEVRLGLRKVFLIRTASAVLPFV